MQQGYQYDGDYYLEIKDGYSQEILKVFTGEDNIGAVGRFSKDYQSYISKVEFTKGNNPNYFDIKVITSGKKAAKMGDTSCQSLSQKSHFIHIRMTDTN